MSYARNPAEPKLIGRKNRRLNMFLGESDAAAKR